MVSEIEYYRSTASSLANTLNRINSKEIGAFAKLISGYCLIDSDSAEAFCNTLEADLSSYISVIRTLISGIKIIGRITVGNKKDFFFL